MRRSVGRLGPALATVTAVASAVVTTIVQNTASGALGSAFNGLLWTAYVGVGLVILGAHHRHLVGRLMLTGGLVDGVGSAALELSYRRLRDHPHDIDAALGATLGAAGRGFGWLLVVLVLPLVFPDGRRTGPRRLTRWAWRVSLTTLSAYTAIGLFSPAQTDLRIARVDNPIGLPHSLAGVTDAVAAVSILGGATTIVLAIVCLVWRWRHGEELRRQQLAWFALAFAPPIVPLVMSFSGDGGPSWLFGVCALPLPVAVGIAVMQRRLYDVQLVVNRSLTYGALSILIAGLYAVVVGGVGAMLRARGATWLPWVAAGVVAVSFAPLRNALQQAANRLTYGQWAQPAEVLAATGRRLSDATDVPALLQSLADELVTGLGLDRVEVADASGQLLAGAGPGTAGQEIPLTTYGMCVGALRHSSRRLRAADRNLLTDLAHQLGGVVHAATLLDTLRESQERLVVAREEERRRLRRDLHDGLGPALAGLTLRVDTMRNRAASRGSELDAALLDLRSGIQGTVLDVRRIIEGLRPPALDELGLEAALAQLADRLTADSDLVVEVRVPPLRGVPAAVEVATYRVAQEALTNLVRHSSATSAWLTVNGSPDELTLCVRDNGQGAAAPRPGGVGMSSMRERAEEIGGTLRVVSDASGTTVELRLPYDQTRPTTQVEVGVS